MGYSYFDVNGYIGCGPSATAMSTIRSAAMKTRRRALRFFVQQGWCEDLTELARDLEKPLAGVDLRLMKSIRDAALKAREILILSDE